jgi:hypothetical protein
MRPTWTPEAVRGLGVRTTIPIAGEIIAGLSETQAYELAKRGGFPVPVVKVGRRMVVPTAPILRLLGLEPDAGAAGPPSPAADTDHARPMPAERAADNAHDTRRRLRALAE